MKPLIYISYGMAKSGSTLGFQLVTAILEEAGIAQSDVDLRAEGIGDHARFVEVIRPVELKALRRLAEDRGGGPLAIKTHSGLWNCVIEGMREGWVIGHAICRDPRDIALSMMDASRKNQPWGKRDGQPLRHIEDALDYVRAHATKFRKWAAYPAIMPLAYEPLAFDTETVAGRIAEQLGVTVDLKRVVKMAKASDTNMNKGKLRRHEQELSEAVNDRVHREFQGFIEDWCAPDFTAPSRGFFGRLTGL
ncbi:MAG: sulfotransferase domain-containing protein [Pseudomonadota bacterium]